MKYKIESGRSMVEMLGVLAIIGTLSIGAINGYSYAIDKYNANSIVQEINLRRTILLSQAYQNTPLNLSEFNEKILNKYTFLAPELFDDSIALTIQSVPQRICKLTADALFPQTIQIDINTIPSNLNSPCDIDNEVTFYFPLNNEQLNQKGQNGCPEHQPLYNAETQKCDDCPRATPKFNTTTQSCEACPSTDQLYNEETLECECPATTPYYNALLNKCVECSQDEDCPGDQICASYNYEVKNQSDPKHKQPLLGQCCDVRIKNQADINSTHIYQASVCGENITNYWNAEKICQATNGTLLSGSDITGDSGKTVVNQIYLWISNTNYWAWMETSNPYSGVSNGFNVFSAQMLPYYSSANGGVLHTVCKKNNSN